MNLKAYLLKEHLKEYEKYIIAVLALIIVFFAVKERLQYFDKPGKDIYAYEKAISDLVAGRNPYKWTVESYANPDDPGNHGFAYFPGMLYLFTPFYIFHLQTGWDVYLLWKIPVLIADLGVGYLLYRIFRDKGILPLVTSLFIWFFNPYTYFRKGYTHTDPITIFFMLLSLILLEKDDVLAGVTYAVSIAMKTFPYILFPVMIIKAKNKQGFLLAGILVGLLVSLPFLKSADDLFTYINGTLLVHQNRFVQGRPFLYYISYFYGIEFFQIVPFKAYTFLASFSGWFLATLAYLFKLTRDKFVLALIPFLTFYLFTPVFNRTYFLWFIPIFSVSMYKLFKNKYRFFFYLAHVMFFIFAGWYLLQWKDGFHIRHP